jgi:class 3 adenylate cyclase/ribosomal protein L40E
MQCPQCQHDSGDGAKFCRKCGGKLALTCDSCGAENPPESSFCGECGEPVEAATSADVATLEHEFAAYEDGLGSAFKNQLRTHGEGENRIITVLFADMSNSVAAMRDLHTEDAASLLRELIHEMVDVLVGYEGTIDNVMGDGVLAVFGLPVAHENDPERAIRAAMDMRVAVRALGLDISAGINTGPVFSGERRLAPSRELDDCGRRR